jgi:hypothetical protein
MHTLNCPCRRLTFHSDIRNDVHTTFRVTPAHTSCMQDIEWHAKDPVPQDDGDLAGAWLQRHAQRCPDHVPGTEKMMDQNGQYTDPTIRVAG